MKTKNKDGCVLDATLYSIEIYVTPLSKKEFKTIAEKFRYYCRKGGCSWLLVFSSTDSKTARKRTEKTGLRGRPKSIVIGSKIDNHIHSAVKGSKERSAFSTCNQIKRSLNKRYGGNRTKVVSKGRGVHALNYVGYSLRQADTIRSGGDFDIKVYIE